MQHITQHPIDLIAQLQQCHHTQSGAVVLFSGEVRAANKGKEVLWLEYEAYDAMAEIVIEQILEEAKTKWHLQNAVCIHRTGKLEIMECAVVVITSAGHRDAAYQANRFIIDAVKSRAPIWKNEFFADGTNEWGTNDCSCNHQHHHEHAHAH